jgi:hypothetical protein
MVYVVSPHVREPAAGISWWTTGSSARAGPADNTRAAVKRQTMPITRRMLVPFEERALTIGAGDVTGRSDNAQRPNRRVSMYLRTSWALVRTILQPSAVASNPWLQWLPRHNQLLVDLGRGRHHRGRADSQRAGDPRPTCRLGTQPHRPLGIDRHCRSKARPFQCFRQHHVGQLRGQRRTRVTVPTNGSVLQPAPSSTAQSPTAASTATVPPTKGGCRPRKPLPHSHPSLYRPLRRQSIGCGPRTAVGLPGSVHKAA